MRNRDGVGADRQINEVVGASAVRGQRARKFGLISDDGDGSAGKYAAALVATVPVMPPRVCWARAQRENASSTASKKIPSFSFIVIVIIIDVNLN